MSENSNTVLAPRTSSRGEPLIREIIHTNLAPEQLRQRVAPLLADRELLRGVRALGPEDQTKFIDKVDQVRRDGKFHSHGIYLLTSAKAYPTVDSRNARFVKALGDLCGAAERLPTSAMLSAGLEKRGNIAVASGGFTDIWRGEYYAAPVAIKAFRIYPAQNLKEAKEVSI